MIWQCNPYRALIALAIFLLEIFIALSVHDHFIRPFIGDVLVVVLIYFAASSVIITRSCALAGAAFVFACSIELGQYLHMATWLGLRKGSMLYVALGATADWLDVLAYAVGALLICGASKMGWIRA
ncbi:MAG: DUF2809 domain-containing protein [Formosimonas sp.]